MTDPVKSPARAEAGELRAVIYRDGEPVEDQAPAMTEFLTTLTRSLMDKGIIPTNPSKTRAVSKLVDDLRPFASKSLGSIRIGVDEVKTLVEWFDCLPAPASPPAEALPSQTSGAGAVAVKALPWGKAALSDGDFLIVRTAYSAVGVYDVMKAKNDVFVVRLAGTFIHDGVIDGLESALSKAQADYERRIRSALAKPASEPAGGGVRDGLAAELLTAYHAIDAIWVASTGHQRLAKHDALAAIHEASRALSSPASSSPAEERDDAVSCLLAEKPFWFDPATNFVHADDGGGRGTRWAPSPVEDVRCEHCDGTGDVHSIDGEWRGRCSCSSPAEAEALQAGVEAVRVEELERTVADLREQLTRLTGRPARTEAEIRSSIKSGKRAGEAQNSPEYWRSIYPDGNFPEGV